MEYDIKAIEQVLHSQQEIIPDEYDGSYELVRETIRCYSRMDSFSDLNYLDLNLVYLMTVGTWRHSVEKKKETISRCNLPEVEKAKLTNTLELIWRRALNNEYNRPAESDSDLKIGMFGTGFYSFQNKTDDQSVRDFIKMCVDIIDLDDTEQIFEIVDRILNKGIKGMRTSSVSMILHCLKPMVFPILNGNFGVNNIYENLGLKLRKVLNISYYIKNCKTIKSYRDKNYDFKNYKVFDAVSLKVDEYKITPKASINVEALKKQLAAYKKDFDRIKKEETYKWQAIKTFQENFDLEADDFLEMLKRAFKDHVNLLNTGSYFMADAALYEIAEHYPEDTRDMFRRLFDESQPVIDRIDQFAEDAKIYFNIKERNEKAKNTYQDEKATTTYLFFKYPDKYSIYRSEKFGTVAKILGYNDVPTKRGERVQAYFNLVDLVWKELQKDPELLALSRTRLTDNCYQDPQNHVLAEDLMWFIYTTNKDKQEEVTDEWYPSLEEFNPGLNKEQYKKVFDQFDIGTLDVLHNLYRMGGVGSCKQISIQFGNTPHHYNSNAIVIAKRIAKEYNLHTIQEEDDSNEKYWPVLFFGRFATNEENGTYVYKLREPVSEAIKSMISEGLFDDMKTKVDYPKNIILYGPPGTGKTYHTVTYAVSIIEGRNLEDVIAEEYSDVKARYDDYLAKDQIAFTTFHQSYGYEEFIEGIKPLMDDSMQEDGSDIKYIVESGVFKRFCNQALTPVQVSKSSNEDFGFNKTPVVWKVSLDGTGDNPVREECMKNEHIRIGWDGYGKQITDEIDKGKVVLNAFINKMRIGDVVLSCYSASIIDAIGVVTSEYEWHPEYDRLRRLRKVKWLAKDLRYNIVDMNGGSTMTLATVYKMNVSLSDVLSILEEVNAKNHKPDYVPNNERYVFIIDEINRGNISKVFGELITLIEPSKRIGQSEEIKLLLPYSKKSFGVPNNVYIIGTMNTADRSIAIMDTALRRRFSFVEMLPDETLLEDIDEIEGINISMMLKKMNTRIEVLLDREHTIGHSYFLPLKDTPSIEMLGSIFKNKIIPLLQEYFFDDYEKIRLVFADNQKNNSEIEFIRRTDTISNELFGTTDEVDEVIIQYSINEDALTRAEAYKGIY